MSRGADLLERGELTQEDLALLVKRIQRVLWRLQCLSEAPASAPLDRRQVGQREKPASAPPPMVNLSHNGGPPSRGLSLCEHYRWRFVRAKGNPEKLELLAMLAERDYWETVRARGRARKPHNEIKEERNRRIIDEYEGMPHLEVAVFEHMDETSIRKLRKEFGRDPQTGLSPNGSY